jgi:hypothetical protein
VRAARTKQTPIVRPCRAAVRLSRARAVVTLGRPLPDGPAEERLGWPVKVPISTARPRRRARHHGRQMPLIIANLSFRTRRRALGSCSAACERRPPVASCRGPNSSSRTLSVTVTLRVDSFAGHSSALVASRLLLVV